MKGGCRWGGGDVGKRLLLFPFFIVGGEIFIAARPVAVWTFCSLLLAFGSWQDKDDSRLLLRVWR